MKQRIHAWARTAACYFLAVGMLTGQENPFELTPRLPDQGTVVETGTTSAAAPASREGRNPFEILHSPPGERMGTTGVEDKALPSAARSVAAADHPPLSAPFLLITVFSLLVFLAVLLTLFRSLLQRIFPALFNQNQFNLLYRDMEGQSPWTIRLWNLFFYFSAGFVLLLWLWPEGMYGIKRPLPALLFLTGGIAIAFFLKYLLLRIVGSVFPIDKQLDQYSFAIQVFSAALGVVLLPIAVLLAFAPESLHGGLLYLAAAVMVLAYLIRSLRGLSIAGSKAWSNKFHFLLYICSVEIAPAIVLFKLIINQL